MSSLDLSIQIEEESDAAIYKSLSDLAEQDRQDRMLQWIRLGHMVMTMASVAPGKESMREYFSDFTSQTDDLIKKLETHTDLFSKKTSRSDGDLGEKYVGQQLYSVYGEDGDSFEVWSSTGHQGDLIGKIAVADKLPQSVLIEVKDYTSIVPSKEVDKFRRDMRENPEMKAGIFISLQSGITGFSQPLTISSEEGRPVVYIAQDVPGQQLFVAVWAMLKSILRNSSNIPEFSSNDLMLMTSKRIFSEIEYYLNEISDDVSKIESIKRASKNISDSVKSIDEESNRLEANITSRANSLGRFLKAETETLQLGSKSKIRKIPWSESEWKNKFIECGADWDKAHGANLTALLRWMSDIDGINGKWLDNGIEIFINDSLKFTLSILAGGLRVTIPEEILKSTELIYDWEKGKPGIIKFNKSSGVNLDPEPIFKVLKSK